MGVLNLGLFWLGLSANVSATAGAPDRQFGRCPVDALPPDVLHQCATHYTYVRAFSCQAVGLVSGPPAISERVSGSVQPVIVEGGGQSQRLELMAVHVN